VATDSIALPGRAMRMQETGSLVSRGIGGGLVIDGAFSLTWRSVKVMRFIVPAPFDDVFVRLQRSR